MSLSEHDKKIILDAIRDVKDFPQEGIVFKDITTLLNNKEAYALLLKHLYETYKDRNLDFIAGAESRGFIFGAPLAQMLGIGFVPIRKPGKLPYTTVSEKYALEYGVDEVEIHIDAFRDVKNPKVLFIDDLIATGGTAEASVKLMKKIGGDVVESCFILELAFLDGKKKVLEHSPVYSVIEL